jgi:hypothetical protein
MPRPHAKPKPVPDPKNSADKPPSREYAVTHKTRSLRLPLMLLPLMTLLAGCAHESPNYHADPPAVPVLPVEAIQPTPPEICLPSCSAGLMRLRGELLSLPTEAEQQD